MLGGKGYGPLFDHALIPNARTVFCSGAETVSVTYALYQIAVGIPKIDNIFDRKAKVSALREAVASKGSSLGDSLEARAVILETQVHMSK